MFVVGDFLVGALILIPFAIVLYALADVLFSHFESTLIKIACFLAILGTPLVGALIYFFIDKRLKQA